MAQEQIECLLFRPDPGDRLRVAIHYGGAWRPIFWFEVAQDGSVYLGPRYIDPTQLRYGVSKRSQGGQFHFTYGDGTEITDHATRKKAKVSFHASGVINTPGGRTNAISLRSISKQRLLCSAIFQHLSAFEPIQTAALRKRDVCLRYPVDESRPLWAHLYVAPNNKAQVVRPRSTIFQMNPFFAYCGLNGVPDILLQLVLGHGAQGPWPPQT